MNRNIANDLMPLILEAVSERLRERIDSALPGDPLYEHPGFNVSKASGGRFDEVSLTVKLEVREDATHESGVTMTEEADYMVKHASYYGLKAADLGRIFSTPDGNEYRILGIRRRATKRPIMCERTKGDGKVVFTAEQVVRLLDPLKGRVTVVNEPVC